jgi:FkbM family methyltransferase
VYFASTFPEARIIGIEPEKRNFLQLQKNTSNYPNVKIHNAALWYEPATLKIKDESDWSASFEVQKSEMNDGELKAITIPQIMAENNFDEIDILKIDIEGAEFDLFSNNPHVWLSKTKCLIIELHDQLKPGTSKLFFGAMAAYDWETYIKGENIICFKK